MYEISNKQFNKILLMSGTPIYDKYIEFNYLLKLIRKDVVTFNDSFYKRKTQFKESISRNYVIVYIVFVLLIK